MILRIEKRHGINRKSIVSARGGWEESLDEDIIQNDELMNEGIKEIWGYKTAITNWHMFSMIDLQVLMTVLISCECWL